ncbi:MAG TPA: hypothetical protein VKW78_08875 [Terriglobales bacterium]|nr:hypothetical protein [Terriglobales bacterium]
MSTNHGSQHAEPYHVVNDVNAAYVELLSAVCAVDRIRMRHSFEDVVKHCEPGLLKKTARSANAICSYFAKLQEHLQK